MTWTEYANPAIDNIGNLFGYANQYTGGNFVFLMVLAMWLIFFSFFKRYELKTAFTAATAVTYIMTLPLSVMKFGGYTVLAPQISVTLLILTALGALWLWINPDA